MKDMLDFSGRFSKGILKWKIQLPAVNISTSWETRLLQPSGEGKMI